LFDGKFVNLLINLSAVSIFWLQSRTWPSEYSWAICNNW